MSSYEARVVLEPPYDGLQLPTHGVVALCWTHAPVLAGMAPSLASNMSSYEARVVLEPPYDGLQLPTDGVMMQLSWQARHVASMWPHPGRKGEM